MNAISTLILISLIIVVLFAHRRWALLGMAAGVLYLTQWTSVHIAGLNMFPMRFLEMAGFIRVMARRELNFSSLNQIDRLFLVFYGYMTIVFLLRADKAQAYQIGLAVDAILCYFTFRGLIKDMDEFRSFLRTFAILLIPYVILLGVDTWTSHNPFSLIVGRALPEFFRKGRVRCMGSFREYSLLGSLGASFLPVYIGLFFSKPNRRYASMGVFLCLAIVWFSNSGGPLAFACIVLLCWLVWFYRDRMRLVRRVGAAGIIALALVMKAPIWYLPTHFSFGGDAWHRSYLVQVAMAHLGEWWLWGMPISKTAHWFAYQLGRMDQADITNQYLSFGFDAGLMTIALFVWLLARSFQGLGKALSTVRLVSTHSDEAEYLLWGLGVMLFGHVCNFFSITYFDQFYVIWFMQLAAISSISSASSLNYLLEAAWLRQEDSLTLAPSQQYAPLAQEPRNGR